MVHRLAVHVVDPDSRARAEAARIAFALGHHAEIYADLAELIRHAPDHGIVLAREDCAAGGATGLLADLARAGIWLPLVLMAREPRVDRVVAAVRAGALDYLPLPLDPARLAEVLHRIAREAEGHSAARRRMIEARQRIRTLTPREREVLDWLADGCSNKAIAQALAISPRTVEIHRAKMMGKLGAQHVAAAVRLRLEARIDEGRPQPRRQA